MKFKHLKTTLLALATTVSALSVSSIALTSCGNESGNVTISTSDKTQSISSSGYAIYTFTLASSASSTSEFSKPVISDISNSSVKLSANIDSVSGTTLKIRVSQTSSNSESNALSVTFSMTIAKADGSWSQTIKNLTLSNLTDAYSITYSSTPAGLTFVTKPTTVISGNSVNVTFTIADGYELDTVNSQITVGGTDVTSSCTFTAASLIIPSTLVTGDIDIKIATEGAATASYKITYSSTPSGLTWTTKPTSAQENKSVTIEYTLSSGYSINTSTSSITVGGTSVKSQIGTYNSGTITIPASLITGDIVISLTTKTSTTYTVNYGTTPDGLTWISKPSTATSGAVFTASYSLDSGKVIDTANSTVTIGGVNKTDYVTFGNGTIIIAADYVTGNIIFSLATKTETDSHAYSDLSGGTITETASSTTTGLTIYTLAASSSDATMNITLSGTWLNSQICIKSSGTYNITLNDCIISNTSTGAETDEIPFNITKKATDTTVNIILANNSENTINDKRSGSVDDDFVLRHNGTGSLNITGNGVLNINNVNSNKGATAKGIQTKCNLNISNNATVNVFAYDTAIQSAGALTIDTANVVADSYYDDAIKTKFEDAADDLTLAGAGNIARDITIKGTSIVKAYSARTGINAAHNVVISGSPTIDIYTTADNANTSSIERVNPSDILDEQNLYIAVPSSAISYSDIENYYFTIDFYDSSSTLVEDSTEVMTLKKIRKDNQYYFFKCDRKLDSDYAKFKINKYAKEQFGAESPTATASSSLFTISSPTSTSTTDCVKITSIGTSISGTFDQNYYYLKENDQQAQRKIDTVISSKGIKAKNNISISSGAINIASGDTCMTASYGDIYCNSETAGDVTFGQGNITISGGTINSSSTYGDGIKAYGTMDVSGGSTTVSKSVEALEAGVINISGGTTKLSASDDGMNASETGKYNTSMVDINISGGILDVQTTSTGDTDAIDSNNTLSITGGLLIARVPGSDMAMSLDWESGSVTASNATVILMGKTEKTISGGTSYSTSSSIYSSGSHTVTYYITSTTTSTYTFNNSQAMNSTKTIRSNFGSPSFN